METDLYRTQDFSGTPPGAPVHLEFAAKELDTDEGGHEDEQHHDHVEIPRGRHRRQQHRDHVPQRVEAAEHLQQPQEAQRAEHDHVEAAGRALGVTVGPADRRVHGVAPDGGAALGVAAVVGGQPRARPLKRGVVVLVGALARPGLAQDARLQMQWSRVMG